jgi:hypothetical protein
VADTGYYDSLIKMDMVQNDALKIDREIDRVYKSTGEIIITDPVMKRRIEIAKSGSRSTVIWNPWIDKAKRMPDFGDDEYPQMVCVEAANVPVVGDARTLAPGEKAVLSQSIRAVKLGEKRKCSLFFSPQQFMVNTEEKKLCRKLKISLPPVFPGRSGKGWFWWSFPPENVHIAAKWTMSSI